VQTDERTGGDGLVDGFVEVPTDVYRDAPDWIPEDPAAVERAFGPDNPWFAQGEAVSLCAADRARVAVFFQPTLRVEERKVAFFGYWETTGEPDADAALFARAEAWAIERGAVDVYGPIDFTTYGEYRLRLSLDAEGALPFPDEPYNPSTYPAILEGLGYTVDQHYLTQIGHISAGRMLADYKRPVLHELEADGYRFETLSPDLWMDSLRELHGIIDAMFGRNFAYSPLTWETFEAKCGLSFIRRACPHSSVISFGPEGDIAGFFLVYPHYGPLVVQAAGADRVESSDLDFATHAPLLAQQEWTGAIAKTTGVAPKHRRKGVMEALGVGLIDRGGDLYDNWFGAMIRKGNPSGRFADAYSAGERWYGLFRKRLD